MRRQGADALIVDEAGRVLYVDVLALVHTARRPDTDHFTYRCRITGGSPRPSEETLDAQWWAVGDVPAWHADHRRRVHAALSLVPEGSGTSGS